MLRKKHLHAGCIYSFCEGLEIFGHVRFAIRTEVTKQVKS